MILNNSIRNLKISKNQILLISILLIAFFLRVYDLDTESLWVDEGTSIKVANFDLPRLVDDRITNAHPPLYFTTLHYWITLFEDSEFSIRYLSVIFGVLGVSLIYVVGYLLFNDEDVGILSALLLAISLFHIQYSQEARGYSMMVLLSLASMLFFILSLEQRNLTGALGYILSSTLLLYIHTAAIFVIIAQNLYVLVMLLTSRKNYINGLKRWIVLQLILFSLFLPWIGNFIYQVQKVQNGFWVQTPSIRAIFSTYKNYSSESYVLSVVFGLLSLFSMITYSKIKERANWHDFPSSIELYGWKIGLANVNETLFLGIWFLIPIALPFLISQVSQPIYIDRITIAGSLALYILVAKGITNIKTKYIKFILVGFIIILSLFNIWTYYTTVTKEQWRETALYIDRHTKSGDLMLFNAGFIQTDVFDYYSQTKDVTKEPFPAETKDVFYVSTTTEADIEKLWPIVKKHDRVWVILSHSRDHNNLIVRNLSQKYEFKTYEKFLEIEVYLFENKQP